MNTNLEYFYTEAVSVDAYVELNLHSYLLKYMQVQKLLSLLWIFINRMQTRVLSGMWCVNWIRHTICVIMQLTLLEQSSFISHHIFVWNSTKAAVHCVESIVLGDREWVKWGTAQHCHSMFGLTNLLFSSIKPHCMYRHSKHCSLFNA